MQVVEYAKKNYEALELIFDANSAYKILRMENWHIATLCNALFSLIKTKIKETFKKNSCAFFVWKQEKDKQENQDT